MRPLVLFALVLLSAEACFDGEGPPRKCSPVTCGGCCDAKGQCQEGRSIFACGLNGVACVSCPPAASCQTAICVPGWPEDAGADGGSDGGADGGRDAGVDGGADAGEDAGPGHVHILISAACEVQTQPGALSADAGTTLQLEFHNLSVDFEADLWSSRGYGHLNLARGAIWRDPTVYCGGPFPYDEHFDVSIAGGPTAACPSARLDLHCQ